MFGGKKTPLGMRPNLSKAQFIANRNRGRFSQLTATDYEQHRSRWHTLYFFGTPFIKAGYTLMMIDIDVQKSQRSRHHPRRSGLR